MVDARLPGNSATAAAQAFAGIVLSAQAEAPILAGQLATACFLGAAESHSCLETEAYFPDCRSETETATALAALFYGNPLVLPAAEPGQPIGPCLMVIFKDRLYLKKYWLMENALLAHLRKRSNALPISEQADISRRLAVSCLEKPLTILTGGPGSGKTTAIFGALMLWTAAFHARHGRIPKILLCAPTGKAAARMNESWQQQKPGLLQALAEPLRIALPDSAQTLHRLLAIQPIYRRSRFNPGQPLQADLMVFDEASMIDLPMSLQLFDALPESCNLLLVGDPEQLPSIEIGSVLKSLISLPSGTELRVQLDLAHIHLQQNFRQAMSSGLSELRRDIMQADPDEVVARLNAGSYADVRFQQGGRQALSALLEQSLQHYRTMAALPDAGAALAMLRQRIILSPVRGGPSGSDTLNTRIRNSLLAHAGPHGQVVMVTENVPALGLANGDIGIVWQHPDGLNVHFPLAAGPLSIPLSELPRHDPAFVLTVHKAQGSEFEHVELLLPEIDNPLLSRPLFYTAATRARASLCITGTPAIVSAALKRDIRRMHGMAALAGSTQQEIQ